MWKRLLRFSGFKLGLLLTLLFCLLELLSASGALRGMRTFEFLNDIENKVLDMKFRLRSGPMTDEERRAFQDRAHVVIVAVDEKSIRMKDLGLWPWPRVKTAELVENLVKCGAKVIGFDMVLAEPDISRAAPMIRAIRDEYEGSEGKDPDFSRFLETFQESVSGDVRMTKVLEASENVVLGYFFFTEEEEVRHLDKKDIIDVGMESIGFGTFSYVASAPGTSMKGYLPKALGVRANLPEFTDAVERYGFFNQVPENDGIYRRVPMVYSFVAEEDLEAFERGEKIPELFPSLSLQVLSSFFGHPVSLYVNTPDGEEVWEHFVGLFIGPIGPPTEEHIDVPVEAQGLFRVNYYGGARTFRHVSAGDVIHGQPEACRAIDGKVVVVGATTTGIYDLRPTPFESNFPGVEIHASVIENVITKNFLVRPYGIGIFETIAMLLVGLLFSWLLTRFRLTIGLVATFGCMALFTVADFFLLFSQGVQARIVLPTVQMLVLFMAIAVYRYATEERQKRETRRAFQFYLSKDVIDTVLQDDSKLMLGGERRELSVLFSDIRGFTSISEGLAPEALTALLNEYLTPMTELVFKYRGTLDKYMGDAIMAFYGAPVAFPDHPGAACRTALDMMEELARLRVGWRERGLPELDIGIGVNTGSMSVGNMGSVNRFDYTVMGDHVNLGSRLEGLNKQYGTHIIISQFTRDAVGDQFTCRELDSVAVKGKKEPVRIFEVAHRGPAVADRDSWIDRFELALRAYREQRWDEANAIFEELVASRDDATSKIFIQRCRDMKANPPGEDWDGVFKMLTK